MTVDTEATKYIGLTIDWDYENQNAHIHMPGYLKKAFTRFKHGAPEKNQNSPHYVKEDAVRQGQRRVTPPIQRRDEIRPSSHWDITLLRESRRPNHSHGNQLDRN